MAGLPRIGAPPHPSDYAGTAAFMRPHVEGFIDGKVWIHVLDPTTEDRDMVFGTGQYTVQNTPLWSGWARVQPIRNSVNAWRATNPTTTRVVQFWVDLEEQVIDLRPGLRIAVEIVATEDNNDDWLAEYQYVIVGAVNSSQAWQRTIDTQVDLENRPNYDMAAWPKPPSEEP